MICVSPGGAYLDATFGHGGHSEALVRAGASLVLALDRDQDTLSRYAEVGSFREDARLRLAHLPFSRVEEVAGDRLWDGAIADLGPNSAQLLTPDRGFSFQFEGPLDMRMDRERDTSLAERLENVDEEELSDVLVRATGSRKTGRLARGILRARDEGRLATTADLARVAGPRRGKTHPATELFLALRMWVNGELEEILEGLPALFARLRPGGRLAVITFHSTEDRVVKRLFKALCGACTCDRTPCLCPREATARRVTRKPVIPSDDELARNPRARSAKLRCVEKI